MNYLIMLLFWLILIIFIILVIYLIKGICEKIVFYKYGSGLPVVTMVGGVHGNEPAGCVGLKKILSQIENKNIKLQKGTLIIIPCANRCGLHWNTRTVPFRSINGDVNRNFPNTAMKNLLNVLFPKEL